MSVCGRVPYPVDIYISIYLYLYLSCRFWHRCGRRFGRPSFGFWFAIWVRYSVATVLRDQRCIRFPLAGLSAKSPQVFPSVSNTCSIFCFFLLYTCGDPSVLRSTPPGVPGSGHRLAPGRAGRGGCSVCSAGQRPSARGVPLAGERFLWHKKWFLLFSTRITLCYLRTCVCSWLATPTGSLWHLGAKLAERWHIRELGLCVLLGARGVLAHLLLYAVALRLEPEVAVGDLVRDRV